MNTLGSTCPGAPGLRPAGAPVAGFPTDANRPVGLPSSHARPRRVGVWLALLLVAAALALTFTGAVMSLDWNEPVRVFVDDEQVFGGPEVQAMSFGEVFTVALALVFSLLVLLVVVPIAVAVGLVLGLGLPLLIVLLLAGLLLSPLILLGWLLIKLLSRGPNP